ncbi:MAG: ATP-binding protein [Candidatus Auribacterota bacterium]|nr:ATP-binding protein [Candidatus Auribacterota bacterium]
MNNTKKGVSNRSAIDVSFLFDITSKLNETPDMASFMNVMNLCLSDWWHCDAVYYYMCDEQSSSLKPVCSQVYKEYPLRATPDETLLWLLEHQTVQIDQVRNNTRKKQGVSVINIPLEYQRKIMGFIQIIVPAPPESISPDEQRMFSILGRYAANIMHTFTLNTVIERNNHTLDQVELYLNSVFENMIHGIMVIEQDGTIDLLSKTMDLIFNLQHKDAVGKLYSNLFPEQTAGIFNDIIHELAGKDIVMDREFEVTLHDNTLLRISITASSIDIDENRTGTIFLVKSLSNCKDLITLAEVDKLKSNFVATVSHEFKTPLNLILGSTNLLQEGLVGSLNEKQLKLVKLIRDGSSRLMVLTKSLLDLAKLEAGKGHLKLEPVSLKNLIDVTVNRYGHILKEHGISLTAAFNDEIDLIVADNEKLAQMMHHVISNAIKYNNPGGYVDITVSLWDKDKSAKFVSITVKDNGIGILEQEQQVIFDEFYRVDDPQVLEREGIGLGLTIAKKVIDLHRGKVTIKSNKTDGTEITIILPKDPRIL